MDGFLSPVSSPFPRFPSDPSNWTSGALLHVEYGCSGPHRNKSRLAPVDREAGSPASLATGASFQQSPRAISSAPLPALQKSSCKSSLGWQRLGSSSGRLQNNLESTQTSLVLTDSISSVQSCRDVATVHLELLGQKKRKRTRTPRGTCTTARDCWVEVTEYVGDVKKEVDVLPSIIESLSQLHGLFASTAEHAEGGEMSLCSPPSRRAPQFTSFGLGPDTPSEEYVAQDSRADVPGLPQMPLLSKPVRTLCPPSPQNQQTGSNSGQHGQYETVRGNLMSRLKAASTYTFLKDINSQAQQNKLQADVPIVHAIIPASHKGFLLGGRNGDIIIKVLAGAGSHVQLDTSGLQETYVLLERGWKVVGFNFKCFSGRAIISKLTKARLEGRESSVTFEVTKDTAVRLGQNMCKQANARFRLEESLGFRTLEELEKLSDHMKGNLLKDVELIRTMVNANALNELEVLLGVKSARLLRHALELRRAIRLECHRDLERLFKNELTEKALLQRDGGGNVALHYCNNLAIASLVHGHCPKAKHVRNSKKQLPLQRCLEKCPEDAGIVELLSSSEADLLELDDDGLSPAMITRSGSPARILVELSMPPWSEVQAALQMDFSQVLPALRDLQPKGLWPLFLSYHLFSDKTIWKDGRHTTVSWARSRVVWQIISEALAALAKHDHSAIRVVSALLKATKGPRHEKLDSREPYRQELAETLWQMESMSAALLKDHYCELAMGHGSAPGSEWLLNTANNVCSDFHSPAHNGLGLAPQMQSSLEPPTWLLEPDLGNIFSDLQKLGIVGKGAREDDSVYDLIRLADATQWQSELPLADTLLFSHLNIFLARWYAAWFQAVCQEVHEEVEASMRAALGVPEPDPQLEPEDDVFFGCSGVRGFDQVCDNVSAQMQVLSTTLRDLAVDFQASPASHKHLQMLARQSVSYIGGINTCLWVTVDPKNMHTLFDHIHLSKCAKVVCIENGFAKSCETPSNFRDFKMFLECKTLRGPVMVELELRLGIHSKERIKSQFSDLLFKGSFDWPRTFETWIAHQRHGARKQLDNVNDIPSILNAVSWACRLGLDEKYIAGARQAILENVQRLVQQAFRLRSAKNLREVIRECLHNVPGNPIIDEAERGLVDLEKAERDRQRAQGNLNLAVESGQAKQLRSAISEAQACGVERHCIDIAADFLERLLQEATEKLSKATNEANFGEAVMLIAAALPEAYNVELDPALLLHAEMRLEEMQARDQLAQALNAVRPSCFHGHLLKALGISQEDGWVCYHTQDLPGCLGISQPDGTPQADDSGMLEGLDTSQPDGTSQVELESDNEKPDFELPIVVDVEDEEALLEVELEMDAEKAAHNDGLDGEAIEKVCNVRDGVNGCRSGITDYDIHSVNRFHCDACDQDYCQGCVDAKMATTKKLVTVRSALVVTRELGLAGADIEAAEEWQAFFPTPPATPEFESSLSEKDEDSDEKNDVEAGVEGDEEDDSEEVEDVISMEEMLESLSSALDEKDPVALRLAIALARQGGLESHDLAAAEKLLNELRMDAEGQLQVAIEDLEALQYAEGGSGGDLEALQYAIQQAERSGCNPVDIVIAEKLLLRQQTANALEDVMTKGHLGELAAAINNAVAVDVKPWLVENAQRLVAKLQRVRGRIARVAFKTHRLSPPSASPRSPTKQIARATSGWDSACVDEEKNVELDGASGTNTDAGELRELLLLARRADVDEETVVKLEGQLENAQTAARNKLQQAMRDKCLADLIPAIAECRTVGLDEGELAIAETCAAECKVEVREMMKKVSDGTVKKRSTGEIESDIRDARAAGVEESIIRSIETILTKRHTAIAHIDAAIERDELQYVRASVNRARKGGMPESDLVAGMKYIAEIEHVVTERLTGAMAAMDLERLTDAIAAGRKAGVKEHIIKDGVWLHNKITQAHTTLKAALEKGDDASALRNAVSNARALDLQLPGIEIAEGILKSLAKESLLSLQSAIDQKDREQLCEAIRVVQSAGLHDEGTQALLKEGRDCLDEVTEKMHTWVTEQLQEAIVARSPELLEEAMHLAWSNNVAVEKIKEAKAVLAELQEMERQNSLLFSDAKSLRRKSTLGDAKNVYNCLPEQQALARQRTQHVEVEEIGPDTADILTAYFAEQKASAKRNPSKESKGSKSSKSSASGRSSRKGSKSPS